MAFVVNKESIGLIAGVCGLVVTAWTGFLWVQSGRPEYSPVVKELVQKQAQHETRLDRTDRDRDRFQANIKDLGEKTVDLRVAVEKLTTVIELNSVERKRAEDFSTPLLPSRSPAAVNPERRK